MPIILLSAARLKPIKAETRKKKRGINICKIKIVKRCRVTADGVLDFHNFVYGIVIVSEEGEELYAPVYPYCQSPNDVIYLREFLEDYTSELLKHYLKGNRLYFSHFLHGFDTGLKDRFKQRWYEKGVIID